MRQEAQSIVHTTHRHNPGPKTNSRPKCKPIICQGKPIRRPESHTIKARTSETSTPQNASPQPCTAILHAPHLQGKYEKHHPIRSMLQSLAEEAMYQSPRSWETSRSCTKVRNLQPFSQGSGARATRPHNEMRSTIPIKSTSSSVATTSHPRSTQAHTIKASTVEPPRYSEAYCLTFPQGSSAPKPTAMPARVQLNEQVSIAQQRKAPVATVPTALS